VPAVGLVYTYLANRRSQYDRVLALTAESGVPPIADDRHVAGMAFEPLSKHPRGQPVRLNEPEMRAVFNVLWYFERVDALYLSLRPALRSSRITRTQALLLDSLGGAVTTWTSYLHLSWVDEAGNKVEADDAISPLSHLTDERIRLAARRIQRGTSAEAGGNGAERSMQEERL
jgi:hypothetical protein